jgi:hypothetical protein
LLSSQPQQFLVSLELYCYALYLLTLKVSTWWLFWAMVVQNLIRAVRYCQRLAHASHPRLAQSVLTVRKERAQIIPSYQMINDSV